MDDKRSVFIPSDFIINALSLYTRIWDLENGKVYFSSAGFDEDTLIVKIPDDGKELFPKTPNWLKEVWSEYV